MGPDKATNSAEDINARFERLKKKIGKNKPKKSTKLEVMAVIAYEYGYQAFLDIKSNRMTYKEMMALFDQIDRARYQRLIENATAARVAGDGSKRGTQFRRVINEWSREAKK